MYNKNDFDEIKRLNFEDLLWIAFIFLSIMNIYGDYNEKEYLKTNSKNYKNQANNIFEFTLIVTFFIYIYFLIRNYNALEKATEEQKNLYTIKLLGSSLLIAGVLCLLYFQRKQRDFTGSPAI